MNSFILDTNYQEWVELEGLNLKAYPRGRDLSNIGVVNTSIDQSLTVLVSSPSRLIQRPEKRTVGPGEFAKFRRVLNGMVTIQWHPTK